MLVERSLNIMGTNHPQLVDEVVRIQEVMENVVTNVLQKGYEELRERFQDRSVSSSRTVDLVNGNNLIAAYYTYLILNDARPVYVTELQLSRDFFTANSSYMQDLVDATEHYGGTVIISENKDIGRFVIKGWSPQFGDFEMYATKGDNKDYVILNGFKFYTRDIYNVGYSKVLKSIADTYNHARLKAHMEEYGTKLNGSRGLENSFLHYGEPYGLEILRCLLSAKTYYEMMKPQQDAVVFTDYAVEDFDADIMGDITEMFFSKESFRRAISLPNVIEYGVQDISGEKVAFRRPKEDGKILTVYNEEVYKGSVHFSAGQDKKFREVDLVTFENKGFPDLFVTHTDSYIREGLTYFHEFEKLRESSSTARTYLSGVLRTISWVTLEEHRKLNTLLVIAKYAEERIEVATKRLNEAEKRVVDFKEGLAKAVKDVRQYMLDKERVSTGAKDYTEGWKRKLEEIRSIPDVETCYLEADGESLVLNVMTERIIASVPDKFNNISFRDFGRYRFTLKIPSAKINIFQLEEGFTRSGFWTKEDPHPHVNGATGEPCLGNLADLLAHTVGLEEWTGAVYSVLEFLKTANCNDSAGKLYVRWNQVDAEGKLIQENYDNSTDCCALCNTDLDEDNTTVCDKCGVSVCNECYTYVNGSSQYEYLCNNCADDITFYCNACDSTHTHDSRASTECVLCGSTICEEGSAQIEYYDEGAQDDVYVYACTKAHLDKFIGDNLSNCDTCGKWFSKDYVNAYGVCEDCCLEEEEDTEDETN